MNSKWQINKIGLLNFWYYDEEEFCFEDGRMLLRGANGSGKSVTMQSFIPLLLDGNMRPERLDPFGSKARRMENYLLEEDDGRDERTAYLYMEFKREDSDTYITIGIGMRARRGKAMDTWYFFIQDGRRIGKDFFLYIDGKDKVPLSKIELKNRLNEGGQVLESQKEYMHKVNSLIFGFETDDAYKEMIDLLIQLRTPKLSKDFKPSIINDILSNSLMPLSEDDLRPMSEAIENMDGFKASLDALKETMGAIGRIKRVFDKYNRLILLQKSDEYLKNKSFLEKEEASIKQIDEETASNRIKLDEMKEKEKQLESELEVRTEEKKSLGESDAVKLKEQEKRIREDLDSIGEERSQKEKGIDSKKEQRVEEEYNIKAAKEEKDSRETDIHNTLDELGQIFTGLTFDEYEFMRQDILENPHEEYGYDGHRNLLEKVSSNVEKGIEKLYEEKSVKERYDELLIAVENIQKERDIKERSIKQREEQLRIIKNEALETLNFWDRDATEFEVPDEVMQEGSVFIEQYTVEDDFDDLKSKIRKVYEDHRHDLLNTLSDQKYKLQNKDREISLKQEEIDYWQNLEDPSPDLPDEVRHNREKLRESGIDYIELYKTIDFVADVEGVEKDRLEESLLKMGVLEAIIVSPSDYEKVMSLDAGTCDKYIFSKLDTVKNSLLSLMEVDVVQNDMFFTQKIASVLGAVNYYGAQNGSTIGTDISGVNGSEALSESGQTSVFSDGHYQLGIITGTITKEYKRKYIGVNAREKYKEETIKLLIEELDELKKESILIKNDIDDTDNRMSRLESQYKSFPDFTDLKTAVYDLDIDAKELTIIISNMTKAQENLSLQQQKLNEVRQIIQEISGKVYLNARLDAFKNAQSELGKYKDMLNSLEVNHNNYRNSFVMLNSAEERLERLDEELDDHLSDLSKIKNRQRRQMNLLESIEEQLKVTDISQIEAKLEACLIRLKEIPEEQKECTIKITQLTDRIEREEVTRESKYQQVSVLDVKVKALNDAVLQEYRLNYVQDISDNVRGDDREFDDVDKISKIVVKQEGAALEGVDREAITGELQNAYHENKAALTEYNPMLIQIFREEDEIRPEGIMKLARLDIKARYRGVEVGFVEFVQRIQEEMDEKIGLIDDKEKELFEDILLGVINQKIRNKIYSSEAWVDDMNSLMSEMKTSSSLKLSLRWKSKKAEHESQLDTSKLVNLLKKDQRWMSEEDSEKLLQHFRSKIQEARNILDQSMGARSFHSIVREILDYRQWFEFRLEYQKNDQRKKELTDRDFFTLSGGEKAMSMYVPLFSAVVAKYNAARKEAPRLISLDEAFAGVDATNINDTFRLMVDFNFSFIINSQILWGDYETVPRLAIYQLIRDGNAKFVTVIPYIWNGKVKKLRE